ncbi:LADA_0F13784g1_1 [Lachancea dasiensis]|uniref:LADA_0F13784g1_1 n=1 Tax=Lachancea dasiensis TaxID=1072105 RepID=A0A1G4JN63_9SACH|nr:LADA_0F13784g1_1 [Lachancea dasiensis]
MTKHQCSLNMIKLLPAMTNHNVFLRPQTLRYTKFTLMRRMLSTPSRRAKSIPSILSSIYTVPNLLTISRIAAAPLIGHCIISNNLVPALALFTYSCLTDFLDGYMARRYNMKSVAGTVLDPMADKILMLVTTASLAFPGGPQIIPASLAGMIIGRDVMLGLSAIYFRIASLKHAYGQVTWSSFWDVFRFPSAEVRPTQISKWNTFLQMIYLGWAVAHMIAHSYTADKNDIDGDSRNLNQVAFEYFGYLVGVTTGLSGASYIFSRNAVKYLNKLK